MARARSPLRLLGLLGLSAAAPAAAFDEARAAAFARISSAANCAAASVESWSCGWKCAEAMSSVKVCQGSSTQAFVGLWEGKCVLSFQGTHDVKSILADLEFAKEAVPWEACKGCRVHGGFLNAYLSLKPCMLEALRSRGCSEESPLRSTGWSLGAALSSLAMVDLTREGWRFEESFDFGKPRLGDDAFAAHFAALFGGANATSAAAGAAAGNATPVAWRVTHAYDPVPQVPPALLGYAHIWPEVFYGGDVSEGHVQCESAQDQRCSTQHSNVAIDLLHVLDHYHYLGVLQGRWGCGQNATGAQGSQVVVL